MNDHNSIEVVILLIANGVTLTDKKKTGMLFWVASISRFLCFPHTEATPRVNLSASGDIVPGRQSPIW